MLNVNNNNPSNGGDSNGGSNFIIKLRGLPWSAKSPEVQTFLEGCNIRTTHFVQNKNGRASGEAFVELASQEDLEHAKTFDKKSIGNRYVEVFESSPDEMNATLSNNDQSGNSGNNTNINNTNTANQGANFNESTLSDPVVRLRGLPYNSKKEDITRFFEGLEIAENGIHISNSKPAGEGFVAFVNMENAQRALGFNRKNIGHRYIEVFESTYVEARESIIADTQFVVKNRGGGPARGDMPQRQQPPMSGGRDNYMNAPMPGPGPGPIPPQAPYIPQQNYDAGYANSIPTKRAMTTNFTIKMRGVPFEAGEKDIYDFFSPVVPIRVEIEFVRGKQSRLFVRLFGQMSGMVFAEFGSREEANEAMTFQKNYIGHRYIELIPLYDGNDDNDNGNKSKMLRT
ncbi:unnamed protein product [Didymodactylos carnosus]|uniref:RRM domain-containing protein n=1 Tax=Didymodactylos carnosus TaxID=1234261 RepID=A0A813SAH3_9BILA|nr:unnamed protein product [Didymodactylos carnosus]CAF3576601.1 unnamed protein product [Didymodactylos carnosus]